MVRLVRFLKATSKLNQALYVSSYITIITYKITYKLVTNFTCKSRNASQKFYNAYLRE